MKLISLFVLLFLIISINSESLLDPYSIEGFIKDLKNDGLFEIIETIKKIYGQDVAIISCEELNENRKGNCKRLVTEYMNPGEIIGDAQKEENIKCIKNINFFRFIKMSNSIIDIMNELLSRKFNKTKANLIYNRIKKRVGNLPICYYKKNNF